MAFECEDSGIQLLAYLHKLVANIRANISQVTQGALKVKLDWHILQDFIDKSSSLRLFLAHATVLDYRPNTSGTKQVSANLLGNATSRQIPIHVNLGVKSLDAADAESLMQEEGHSSSVSAKFESQDNSRGDENLSNLQSIHAGSQGLHHRLFGLTSPYRQTQAIQILHLVCTWRELFHDLPLPALVLFHAIKPPHSALGVSVAPFSHASHAGALQCLKERITSCCNGLLEVVTTGDVTSHDHYKMSLDSPNVDLDQPVVVVASQAFAESVESFSARDLMRNLTTSQGFDAPSHLASSCLRLMRTTGPLHTTTTLQRYLMYLTHILRHSAHLSPDTMQQYLSAISSTMASFQSSTSSNPLPWSTLPQPMDSLHLKPEFRIYSDVFTFAAREALPLHPHTHVAHDETRRRFAITAHALSSWSSRLHDTHALKRFEPSLDRRRAVLLYLLRHLAAPESCVCGYSLWAEAVRMCNSGYVREPVELLGILLATSRRPDLLWQQGLEPLLASGYRTNGILDSLKDKVEEAVAPALLIRLIVEMERREEFLRE